MMRLTIRNCNNIENGEFDITDGRLNIKYAINGTGKSTISKAIEAFVTNNQEKRIHYYHLNITVRRKIHQN